MVRYIWDAVHMGQAFGGQMSYTEAYSAVSHWWHSVRALKMTGSWARQLWPQAQPFYGTRGMRFLQLPRTSSLLGFSVSGPLRLAVIFSLGSTLNSRRQMHIVDRMPKFRPTMHIKPWAAQLRLDIVYRALPDLLNGFKGQWRIGVGRKISSLNVSETITGRDMEGRIRGKKSVTTPTWGFLQLSSLDWARGCYGRSASNHVQESWLRDSGVWLLTEWVHRCGQREHSSAH